MIVYGGDMVSGFAYNGKRGWFKRQWRRVIAPALAAGIPYAFALGNHDDQADLNRRGIMAVDKDVGGALALSQPGPAYVGGASNFWLEIYPPAFTNSSTVIAFEGQENAAENVTSGASVTPADAGIEAEAPAARVWVFDSLDTGCAGIVRGWGCVAPTTVRWAATTAAQLPPVPTAVAFVHIPLPETLQVWKMGPFAGVVGQKREPCNCPQLNTGLLQILKDAGVGAVWSGHDHRNDYEGWHGDGDSQIRVGYGKKGGYGSYSALGQLKGARIVVLKAGQPAQAAASWLALEDGTRQWQAPPLRPMVVESEQCRSGAGTARVGVAAVGAMAFSFVCVSLFF